MREDSRISKEEAEAALQEPLQTRSRDEAEIVVGGEYYTEEVRRQLVTQFGEKPVLEGGLAVKHRLMHGYRILRPKL